MKYRPSNGTEAEMFFAQCEGCIHDRLYHGTMDVCAVSIGSRVMASGLYDDGAEFTDDELDPATVRHGPAKCLKRKVSK